MLNQFRGLNFLELLVKSTVVKRQKLKKSEKKFMGLHCPISNLVL